MKNWRIMFVDDDRDILSMVDQYLKMQGYSVITVDSGLKALDIIKDQQVDIIFTDYKMPEFSGLELLAAIKKYKPEIEVIIVTGYGSMESAIQAMKYGSYDYLQKPFKLDHLKLIIDRIIEEKKIKRAEDMIRKRSLQRHRYHDLLGISPKMQQVYELAETAARTNSMVLIQGESGTGKELVARTIHAVSQRADKPFVPVNCGSVSETMEEDRILDHVTGLINTVGNGTIYLDEIADLSPGLRLNLLQALEREQRKTGERARVITATAREIGELVQSGALQKDLFDLLDALLIKLPPLRERREDICLLINEFIYKLCRKHGKAIIGVHPEALDILMRYHWPGNLIQLQNVIERALALEVDQLIRPGDLPSEIRTFSEISKLG